MSACACALNTVKLPNRRSILSARSWSPPPRAERPHKEKNLNQCRSCRLTRPAAGWRSSGGVRRWGRRAELVGSSARTAAGFAAWRSPEPAECCWLHGPPCCGRHWALEEGGEKKQNKKKKETYVRWSGLKSRCAQRGGGYAMLS